MGSGACAVGGPSDHCTVRGGLRREEGLPRTVTPLVAPRTEANSLVRLVYHSFLTEVRRNTRVVSPQHEEMQSQ